MPGRAIRAHERRTPAGRPSRLELATIAVPASNAARLGSVRGVAGEDPAVPLEVIAAAPIIGGMRHRGSDA